MYDKKRVKLPNDDITLDWILSKVSEYDIYAHYIGQFKVGMIYNSPFRKDKNPSFGVYYSKRTKQLLFKDHGTGECGNVIKFVQLYTGKTNYQDILLEPRMRARRRIAQANPYAMRRSPTIKYRA